MKSKLIWLILASCLIFAPALTNYFSADDWYHLRISQIHTLQEFFNFFSFAPNTQTASFYRPLSTQVFFFLMQKLFGLWVLPWHLVVTIAFGWSVYLVYQLVLTLQKKHSVSQTKNLALTSAIIYGFSVTNFTHLYFLSTFQEIAMVLGMLIAFINYLNHKKIATIFWWIIALLSKETAIAFLALILMYELIDYRQTNSKIPQKIFEFLSKNSHLLFTGTIYLFLRFAIFVPTQGDSYLWNFSPIRALNTLFWYTVWSIGVPEMMVDFIGSGLKPIPRFYTAFGNWWFVVTIGFIALSVLLLVMILKTIKRLDRNIIFAVSWFLISLLPVLFIPWHKFTLELGLPMVGFAILLAWLITKTNHLGKVFLILWIIFNLLMNRMTWENHYTVNRSEISLKVVNYFKENYPTWPNREIWFVDNDSKDIDWGGSSKQVAHSINKSEIFKVIYKNHDINVYYQGIDDREIPNDAIKINAKEFIN